MENDDAIFSESRPPFVQFTKLHGFHVSPDATSVMKCPLDIDKAVAERLAASSGTFRCGANNGTSGSSRQSDRLASDIHDHRVTVVPVQRCLSACIRHGHGNYTGVRLLGKHIHGSIKQNDVHL